MTIGEAIERIGRKKATASIGKAVNVDKERGRCDVELEGRAPAVDARLELEGGKGMMNVPREGSDVVVLWVEEVMPVVVMCAEVEETVIHGGENGGLINIADLVDKVNGLIDAFNSHTHTVNTTGTAAAQTGTAAATTQPATKITREEIEDNTVRH